MIAETHQANAYFPRLFSPFELRGKTFGNRLFLAPHGTGYASGGRLGKAALAYYEARLKGGVGLIYTEATQVVSIEGQEYAQLTAGSDEFTEDVAKLSALCRRYDARCFVQIYHEGRARAHSRDGSVEATIAPSALRDERFHVVPKEMSIEEIQALTAEFAAAARRAADGGADGIELLVGMGYLHGQFLSPRVNIRDDAYGGSPENRLRFLAETLAAMREAAGPEPIIGFRIVPEDDDPDGLRLEDSLPVCKTLAERDLTDYISVTVGSTHTLAGTISIVPSMFADAAKAQALGREVRQAAGVPVFVTGRINQPQIAEDALANGAGDMIGMVRALLTDPQLPNKAMSGRAEDIRACIGCNQACIGHRNRGHGVSCIQFPESGRELTYGIRKPPASHRRVVVVGGGPAGMKAAAVLAERGHETILLEAQKQLGGQALLAQSLPGRAEFGGIITNLAHEIRLHAVDTRLQTEASPEMIEALAPDDVIIATGAKPHMPAGEFDEAHCLQAWDVVKGTAKPGARVLVADWRCDWVGPGVAEQLALDGHSVTLCVNGETLGQSIQQYVRFQLAGKLHDLQVRVIPFMRVFGADADTAYLQHIVTGAPEIVDGIDTVVMAWGSDPEISLHSKLAASAPDYRLHRIGDCLSPRTAEEAVLDALKCAADL